MYTKLIAGPAAALLKSTVVMGLLAVASVTTAYDADAARHCTKGFAKYEGRCVPFGVKLALMKRKSQPPTPMCPFTMPLTGQVVNLPCSNNSPPFTGKTCPLQTPAGPIQVPC